MAACRHVGMLACRHVAEGGFSVTNLGNLDRIRHDQGWPAEGGFSVTNLGNLDRIRQDQGWLAEG